MARGELAAGRSCLGLVYLAPMDAEQYPRRGQVHFAEILTGVPPSPDSSGDIVKVAAIRR